MIDKVRDEIMGTITHEGNEKRFTYKGYDCLILRPHAVDGSSSNFHLCGYVKIPEGHWAEKKSYTYINNELPKGVHGGITLSADYKDLFGGSWAIGFDCAHCFDISNPIDLKHEYRIGQSSYKDMQYVEKELQSLVDQLQEVNPKNERYIITKEQALDALLDIEDLELLE